MQEPIFVVGAARSGTHLVATTLRKNLDVVYTGEVNELWKRYVPPSRYDSIPSSAASEEVIVKLRNAFEHYVETQGGGRLLEKTPANTLRLPFVTRVFPDARIVHIVRDGRDVALSARRKYRGNLKKMTKFETPRTSFRERLVMLVETAITKMRLNPSPRSLLSNLGRYWKGTLSHLGYGGEAMWGPRFPGWETYFKHYSILEVAAIQWRASVDCVENFLAARPDVAAYDIKYEDLVAHPDETLAGLFRFLHNDTDHQGTIRHDIVLGGPGWKEAMDMEERRAVAEHIEDRLVSRGYEKTFSE